MVHYIKGNGIPRETKDLDGVFKFGKMVVYMRANGKMTWPMVEGD